MKFLFITALLCALISECAFSQQAGSQAASSTASISGIVTQYGSGEPVRGAEVSVQRLDNSGLSNADEAVSQSITVLTDRNGRFQFPSVAPGEATISVHKNGFHGFRTQNSLTWEEGTTLKLAPGQAITDLALALQPGAVISGRVTDETGQPMPGVQVNAFKWVYANHHRQLRAIGGNGSDATGNYRIPELEPGRYIVRANTMGQDANKRMRYAPCFFPDASTPGEANTLTLRPGEQSVADLRMSRVPVARVSGHVNGAHANGQTQVYLRYLNEGGVIHRGSSGTVDEHGNFSIEGVFPGDYLLVVFEFAGDSEEAARQGELPLKVDGTDIKDLNLSLEDTGHASLDGSLHLEGSNVRHPRFDTLRIGLLPADDTNGNAQFLGQGAYGPIAPDGTIHLDKVSPGKYVVSITAEGSGWEDFYTKSVQVGGVDVTDNVVNINSSRGVIPISVSVGMDGAYVEGTVTDEDNMPIANATVIGVPEQPLQSQFDLYQRGESDENGHFRLRGIKPGTYSFYAWNNMEDESYMDPEFLRRYENSRVDLSLNPKDRQTLHLTVLSTDGE